MGRSGDPRRRAAGTFVGLGTYAEATPARQQSGRARLATDTADAMRTGQHYWTAIAQFALSQAGARAVAGLERGTPNLDTENLLGVQSVCYICEQPLTAALLGTRCPGDPSGELVGGAR